MPNSLASDRSSAPIDAAVRQQDLGRITLTVVFIGGLLVTSIWVLRPFLPAILWATTLVLATWPLLLTVQRHVGNRRSVAVLIMTLGVLLILILPIWAAVSTVVENIDVIGEMVRKVLSMTIPPPPDWVAQVPVVGDRIAETWAKLSELGVKEFAPRTRSLCRRLDTMDSIGRRQPGRDVSAIPADHGDRGGDVRQR